MADDQLSALVPPKKKAKTEEGTSNTSENTEHKNAASSSCFGCKAEPGVTKCRYGCLSVDMCRSNDGGASSNDVKWCTSCVDSGNGFMCPVCKEYQCPKCEKKNKRLDRPTMDISQIEDILSGRRAMIADDNDDKSDESSVPSDNSWDPEQDVTLRKEKCQHCEKTVCQLLDSSCYNLCDICGEASCKLCIKKHGEKWLQCEGCLEDHCNNADAFTGRFFVLYCTNCKHKGAGCGDSDCEGELDYYEEEEEADAF
jgi:hypothetical protein